MIRTTAIILACGAVLRTLQTRLSRLERRKANKGQTISSPDEAGADAFILTNSRKIQLYCRKWGSADSARAAVILLHSELLDSRHFRPLAEELAANGCVCYGLDLTGFGKSGSDKTPSHIEHFGDYIDDLETVISHIRSQNTSIPVVLYGEDLGATVSLVYGMDYAENVKAIVAASVKLEGREVEEGIWSFFGKLCSTVPGPREKPEYEIGELYEDAEVAVAAKENFKNLEPASYRKITEIAALCKYAKTNASKLTTPVLLLQGKEDQRNRPELLEEFKEQTSSTTKYLREYPGGKHGLLYGSENNAKMIRKDIITFLDKSLISTTN